MNYHLSICLERFYAETLQKTDMKLSGRPLIVHRDKKVLDMDALAEKAGAKIGMALSEAKALLQDASFVAWEEETYREACENWLNVCTDYSDCIEPDGQNCAYLDLSLHPDPCSIVWVLQKALFEQLGWQSRTGLASSKWIAKVAETVNGDGELPLPYLEPCEHPIRFLSSLSTRYLLPVSEQDRMRLRFLGYRTIGEVTTVPLSVLREQFGHEGLVIHQACHGGVQQQIAALYPKDSFSTRVRFDSPVCEREQLERFLHTLANRLSKMLQENDRQGNELIVSIEFDQSVFEKRERKFMKPMKTTASIFCGLNLVLQGLEQPVIEVRVRMPNLQPAERFQRELSGSNSAVERSANTLAAFNYIRTVFGDHAIEVAGEKKETRRAQLLRAWKDATGWS